jgi:hypothetical protein
MKELVLRDEAGYRLRVVMDNTLDPGQSKNVQFFQEVKNTDGSVRHTSSHQFFMTREELNSLGQFFRDTTEVANVAFVRQVPTKTTTKVFTSN